MINKINNLPLCAYNVQGGDFLFVIENKSFRRNGCAFCLSLPYFLGDGRQAINEYIQGLSDNCISSFSCCHVFMDVFGEDDEIFSGLLVICGYNGSTLVDFGVMPVTMEISTGRHIPLWKLAKVGKGQKNTPYCLSDNTAWAVENLFHGEKIKFRRKNYRSLIKLIPIQKIT